MNPFRTKKEFYRYSGGFIIGALFMPVLIYGGSSATAGALFFAGIFLAMGAQRRRRGRR